MASDGERAGFGGDQHNSPAAAEPGQDQHAGGEQGQMKRDEQGKPEDEGEEVIYYYRTEQTITTTIGDPELGGGGTGLDYLGGTGGGGLATGTDYLGGTGGAAGGGK